MHALRASTAAPSYFEEFVRDGEVYSDGIRKFKEISINFL